jgi:2-polyprenyl-3-methyl-5-hydroxy-6-metoxy-1,4-benzoquinol methylase
MKLVPGELLRSAMKRVAYHPLLTTTDEDCPVCSSRGQLYRKVAYRTLYVCPQCSHVYLAQLPRPAFLRLFYSRMQYWHYDRGHQGIFGVHAPDQWAGYLSGRIGILTKTGLLADGKLSRIFEIGCAEGMLLKALAEKGHEAEGCELNDAIAGFGRREIDAPIITGMFEELSLPADHYDLIVSYHTLEHLRSPASVLEKAAAILRSTGGVCVEVPVGPEEYPNTDHLHFFTRASLARLLNRFFAEVRIEDNAYRNAAGVEGGSIYGIGRWPAKPGQRPG